MNRRHLPFWLLTAAIVCGLTLPRLVAEGMFLDGMIYAAISRNMAFGHGSLWKPYFSETLFAGFFADHPPLVFWIQSMFFRVLGDHFLVEALYSFATAVCAAILIVVLWRRLTVGRRELSKLSWFAVFFWAAVPQVCWSYSNNMLENTLTVFMLGSVFLLMKGLMDGRRRALYVVLAGIIICLGALSKGPLAFFPVATIGLYRLIVRRITFRAALGYSFLLVIAIGAVFAILWSGEDARANISRYVEVQLAPSLQGRRTAVGSRFSIVGDLAAELAIMMILCAALFAIGRTRLVLRKPADGPWRHGLLMIALGAAGSLPLIASPRQNAFYMIPAFPFYSIGFALLVSPVVSALVERIRLESRRFRYLVFASGAILAIVLALSFAKTGKPERGGGLAKDVKRIVQIVPKNSVVSICESMNDNWGVFALFARYGSISLDWEKSSHEFAVTEGNCRLSDAETYEEVDLGTSSLRLYRKRIFPPYDQMARIR